MFVMSLQRMKLIDFEIGRKNIFLFVNYIFRKGLFAYVDVCVCSQFQVTKSCYKYTVLGSFMILII